MVTSLLPRVGGGPSTRTRSSSQSGLFVSSRELRTLVPLCARLLQEPQPRGLLAANSQLPGEPGDVQARPQEGGGSVVAADVTFNLGGARLFTLYCHSDFALFRRSR